MIKDNDPFVRGPVTKEHLELIAAKLQDGTETFFRKNPKGEFDPVFAPFVTGMEEGKPDVRLDSKAVDLVSPLFSIGLGMLADGIARAAIKDNAADVVVCIAEATVAHVDKKGKTADEIKALEERMMEEGLEASGDTEECVLFSFYMEGRAPLLYGKIFTAPDGSRSYQRGELQWGGTWGSIGQEQPAEVVH